MIKTWYVFRCFLQPHQENTDFCLQIFVYNSENSEKEKQHSQNLLHFENESTLQKRTTFWKMKAHSETHFEDKMFSKK